LKVSVIGSGYVGLVTGACLADVGNDVLCLDLNPEKIKMLNDGEVPIHEPGLDLIISRNIKAGRLKFTTDIEESAKFGLVQMIAVGTPPDEDGSADMQYVLSAAKNIGRYMDGYRVVVDKSTVPVGTADRVAQTISAELASRNEKLAFAVVSNPEFLKEGAAIEDFTRPDRIILGVEDEKAEEIMRELYSPFQRNVEKTISMSIRSAELTKYAANAMLATRISFMNELSRLAEKVGADIEAVRKGIGSDPRIGRSFLYAGTGYGGSCFPKDVKALARSFSEQGLEAHLLESVERVNDAQKSVLVTKAKQLLGDLKGKHIALWGLSFKPETDDMREAPSLVIIEQLLAAGATVSAYDPVAAKEAARIIGSRVGITFAASRDEVLSKADVLMIVTEWKEFRTPNFELINRSISSKAILDGRNLYEPAAVERHGLKYYAIGRGRG
jgi:UDPglucose 6-dehydrogenase